MMPKDAAVDALPARIWCPALNSWVRVLERRTLFGREIAKVVPEAGGNVYTVPADALLLDRPFELSPALATVAGARIWQSLGSDLFLAPLVSRVLPLPHQFRALRHALREFPVRRMLAEEVGLGKTIEAGLILKELKLRGLVQRVLILTPKSLLLQWVVEMENLFDERFDLVLPGDWGADVGLRGENAWKRHAQVITSFDSVKPKDSQKGWTTDRVARYNVERFHDLVGAGFDLVIFDEAHKVAGASDDVGRYEVARQLARTAPHLLLLTATPHSGKSDAFRRLLTLLDGPHFSTGANLSRELVEPFVIRTEKRAATDADGKPLFAPRSTQLVTIPFGPRHAFQKQLYEDVSEYVIEGYNKAQRGAGAKGSRLLLILIQRLVSSSTHAVRRFLQQRAEVLRGDETAIEKPVSLVDMDDDADLDLDEAAQGVLLSVPTSSDEQGDVERLLALALRVEAAGPDARAEALYDHMKRLCQDDGEPSKKFLVFTEFMATQQMLAEFLGQRGYEVALLNGAMDIGERKAALERFRHDAQVLLSTDAGGEGLNMQFAHVVINYDLPWNPMRVEQRIGRVDRIGQKREVRALNFVLENSVEARLYDIWQVKLATILAEYGVDKTGDVLDSTIAGAEFEKLARTALVSPDALEHEFDRVVTDIKRAAQQAQDTRALFTSSKIESADRPPTVPLQAWLRTIQGAEEAADPLAGENVNLSERLIEKINALTPFFAPGKPVPQLTVDGLGFPLDGWFALWKIGIADGLWRQQSVFALYTSDDGTAFGTAAQRLWDELATQRDIQIAVEGETDAYDYAALERQAEEEALEVFESVVAKTRERARRRRDALDLSYLARRSALASIEMEAVREARRRELDAEYEQRKAEIALATESLPDLVCLFLARITAS